MNYQIRSATPDDHDFIYALKTESVRPYVEKIWGWDEAFQREDFDNESLAGIKDPGICMLLPVCLFVGAMVLLGVYSMPLTDFLQRVSQGLY